MPVLLGRIEFDFQRFGVYSLTVLGVYLTGLPLVTVCQNFTNFEHQVDRRDYSASRIKIYDLEGEIQ